MGASPHGYDRSLSGAPAKGLPPLSQEQDRLGRLQLHLEESFEDASTLRTRILLVIHYEVRGEVPGLNDLADDQVMTQRGLEHHPADGRQHPADGLNTWSHGTL